MSVLIDTCIFVALSNSRDVNHERASQLMEDCVAGKFGKPYLSDYIFDETVTTALVRSRNHRKSVMLGDFILDSELDMIGVDEICFQKAWAIYKKTKLSFTDCSSLSLMDLYGIKNIMTFDKELKKASGNRYID